jgi:hypothetical protein
MQLLSAHRRMSQVKHKLGQVSDAHAQRNMENGVLVIPPHKVFFAYCKA